MKRKRPLGRRREDDSLVLADGVNGEWGPHDLRRTGATMMGRARQSLVGFGTTLFSSR
jgi:hypothetical protein